MDYRHLFGFAAILLSGSVFIQSLNTANAFPQGPNVSMGSNPIKSWAGSISSSGWYTIDTVQQDFIITDLVISGSGDCSFQLHTSQSTGYADTGAIATGYFYTYNGQGESSFTGNFRSGMKVTAGTTLHALIDRNGYCHYNISGYYAH